MKINKLQKKNAVNIKKESIAKPTITKPQDVKSVESKNYKKLTDANALNFFLEYDKHNKENKVRITTEFGDIDILLYDKTKYHRANFIYLTKRKYFDGTQFYRVVKNFVIQGGNSDDYQLARRRAKIGKYLLPPDTKRGYTHKRGAISMPSSEIENAYKLASPFQFFIVQRPGGAAYLDKEYSVFGEVIKGMEVVDKISNVPTDDGEWPLKNVYIKSVKIIE